MPRAKGSGAIVSGRSFVRSFVRGVLVIKKKRDRASSGTMAHNLAGSDGGMDFTTIAGLRMRQLITPSSHAGPKQIPLVRTQLSQEEVARSMEEERVTMERRDVQLLVASLQAHFRGEQIYARQEGNDPIPPGRTFDIVREKP